MRQTWKLTEEEKDLIPVLVEDGFTVKEIAKELGVTSKAVRQLLDRRRLKEENACSQ